MAWAHVGPLQLPNVGVVKLPEDMILLEHIFLVLLPIGNDLGSQSISAELFSALFDDAEAPSVPRWSSKEGEGTEQKFELNVIP